jgi:hypothetical protein
MAVSTFDLFKIGIGPSSSHTVGPMRAAVRFVTRWLLEAGQLEHVARVRCELFGSLALTGRGHGTDKAVLMGLEGEWPDRIDPDGIPAKLERIRNDKILRLLDRHAIAFDEKTDLVFNKRESRTACASTPTTRKATSSPHATTTPSAAASWSTRTTLRKTASSPTRPNCRIRSGRARNCSRAARKTTSRSRN